MASIPRTCLALTLLFISQVARGEDWTMGGRSQSRNPVSVEMDAPIVWQYETRDRRTGIIKKPSRNIRWSAPVGGYAFGGPIVAGGLVWVGTSNAIPLDPEIKGDLGVLACFRESDGKFLYQHLSPRRGGLKDDWPSNGISGSPIVEGDKLWFITNRREVVCLDTGPIRRGDGLPTELWKYDLVKEHGIVPNSPMLHAHNTLGSLAIDNDLLFVPTGNGVGEGGGWKVRAPGAPSLVCLRKKSGKLVWKQNSPDFDFGHQGHNVSPLLVKVRGKTQVVHAQGDGWVAAFEAETGAPVWTFDTNHKDAVLGSRDEKNGKLGIAATPVFAEGRIFVSSGREVESRSRPGRLCCIDPTKMGDVSPELDDGKGHGKANPNSALIWDFTQVGKEESEVFHETMASVAVHDGIVIAPDSYGFVHCLDAKTGKRHWIHDMQSRAVGDPLIVAGKVYIVDEDGDVEILKLSTELKVLAKHESNGGGEAPPIFANGTLYFQARHMLHAIGTKQ